MNFTSDAERCRTKGWQAGTRLVGDEGHGPTIIRLTAIGKHDILAVAESHNGVPARYESERTWTLLMRDWKEVKP